MYTNEIWGVLRHYPQCRQEFITWGREADILKSSDLTELQQNIREIPVKPRKHKKLYLSKRVVHPEGIWNGFSGREIATEGNLGAL